MSKHNKTKATKARNSASVEIEALQAQLAELQARLAELTASATPSEATITRKGNWLWISFSVIPGESDRAIMKAAGGRYSGKRRQWYIACRTEREASEIEASIRRGGVEALKAFPAKTTTRRVK